jgi:hypothetical protein
MWKALFGTFKAFLSHNNICEKNIYINTKFIWKLNGFDLSLSFQNMTKDNLIKIKPFKKSNLTPEEETEQFGHFEVKSFFHSIDVYCWAIMFNELLNSHSYLNNSDASDYKYLKECLDVVAVNRPKIDGALELSLFKLSKLLPNDHPQQHFEHNKELLNEQLALINEFSLNENYSELENESVDKLISYIEDLARKLECEEHTYDFLINENFINFLLQPFMFFSDKIRKFILPAILVARSSGGAVVGSEIQPFINENKYVAYVLPRILSLFLLKILCVRLVLLDYFQYFIYFIRNNDTLRFEILPE